MAAAAVTVIETVRVTAVALSNDTSYSDGNPDGSEESNNNRHNASSHLI